MNPTEETRHEVVVDTKIAEAYEAWMRSLARLAEQNRSLMYDADFRPPNRRGDRWRRRVNVDGEFVWQWADLDDAIAILRAKGDERILHAGATGNEILAKYEAALSASNAAQQAYYEAEQDYDGWSRFYLVPGGHIHSSMDCSTCNHLGNRTVFNWLPDLSGLSEAEAVAAHGPVLCTVCFPSAPLDWTLGQLNAKGEYVAPKTYCEGSGKPAAPGRRPGARYGACTVCGYFGALTQAAQLRKHQPEKEKS